MLRPVATIRRRAAVGRHQTKLLGRNAPARITVMHYRRAQNSIEQYCREQYYERFPIHARSNFPLQKYDKNREASLTLPNKLARRGPRGHISSANVAFKITLRDDTPPCRTCRTRGDGPCCRKGFHRFPCGRTTRHPHYRWSIHRQRHRAAISFPLRR